MRSRDKKEVVKGNVLVDTLELVEQMKPKEKGLNIFQSKPVFIKFLIESIQVSECVLNLK